MSRNIKYWNIYLKHNGICIFQVLNNRRNIEVFSSPVFENNQNQNMDSKYQPVLLGYVVLILTVFILYSVRECIILIQNNELTDSFISITCNDIWQKKSSVVKLWVWRRWVFFLMASLLTIWPTVKNNNTLHHTWNENSYN